VSKAWRSRLKLVSYMGGAVLAAAALVAAILMTVQAEGATEDPGRTCADRIREEKRRFAPKPPAATPPARVSRSTRNGTGRRLTPAQRRRARRRAAARRRAVAARERRLRRAEQRAGVEGPPRGPQPVDSRGQVMAATGALQFPFGNDRETVVRHQVFRVPRDMRVSQMRVTAPFADVLDLNGNVVPYTQVAAAVTRRGPGPLFTVAVCINPAGPIELASGTYSGAVVAGAGERITALPLEATVQDDRWWRVLWAALIGAIAGLLLKLFADARDGTRKRTHMKGPKFWVAVGAAGVTGIYSILTIYVNDATFHASFDNLWRITVEVFAGTIAAKAVTDLTTRTPQEREPDAPAPGT
jgi:hypothetical protein